MGVEAAMVSDGLADEGPNKDRQGCRTGGPGKGTVTLTRKVDGLNTGFDLKEQQG